MKIAIIGSKGLPAKYGGVQYVVEMISKYLVIKGHSVTVYARSYYSSTKYKVFYYNGVRVINIKGCNTKRLDTITHSILSSIKSCFEQYDIVVYHSVLPGMFSFIPKLCGRKTVLHSHGLEHKINKWNYIDKYLTSAGRRLTARFIDRITTVSTSELEFTKNIYRNEVELIQNGIELYPFVEKKPENYFLFVGRIVEGKGLEYLIKAFHKISELYANYKLLIVGEAVHSGKYYKYLKEICNNNNNIVFLGKLNGIKLLNIYSRARAVIIPSEYESFSITTLEALYYNGVVVCADIQQLKEVFGKYALFFKSKDHRSLSKKLLDIISDNEEMDRLKENRILFPFNDYSWDKIATCYEALYKELNSS